VFLKLLEDQTYARKLGVFSSPESSSISST
jgi:hypothetical protein